MSSTGAGDRDTPHASHDDDAGRMIRYEAGDARRTRGALRAMEVTQATRVRRRVRRDVAYLDTFDWRVAARHGSLALERRAGCSMLVWRKPDGAALHRLPVAELPAHTADLPVGPLREALHAVVGAGRLRVVAEVRGSRHTIDVLDDRRKTVARVHVDRFRGNSPGDDPGPVAGAVTIEPLRGFAGAAESVRRVLDDHLDRTAASELDVVLDGAGRRVGDTAAPVRWPRPGSESAAAPDSPYRSLIAPVLAGIEEANGDPSVIDAALTAGVRRGAERARAVLDAVPPDAAGQTVADACRALRDLSRAARRFEDGGELIERLPGLCERLPHEIRGAAGRLVAPLGAALERRRDELAAALRAAATPLGSMDPRPAEGGVRRLAERTARAWVRALAPAAAMPTGGDGERRARRMRGRLARIAALVELAGDLVRRADVDSVSGRLDSLRAHVETVRRSRAWRRMLGRAASRLGDRDVDRAVAGIVARLEVDRDAALRRIAVCVLDLRRSRRAARLLTDLAELR